MLVHRVCVLGLLRTGFRISVAASPTLSKPRS
eukprot:COSAG05_NODE_3082_length_2338_cov_1.901295_1_plen_31_part_10